MLAMRVTRVVCMALLIAVSLLTAHAQQTRQTENLKTMTAVSKGLTDVPGIKVGHYTLTERPTGCTVVLTEGGAVAGVDVRGSAPGTIETDLLNPLNLVQQVHAVFLSG